MQNSDQGGKAVFSRNPGATLPLRTNFIWSFSGRAVYALSQWGILIVLSKLTTPEMVGKFGLAIATAAPVFSFADLNLRAMYVTDARDEYRFADYLSGRIVTMAVVIPMVIALSLAVGYDLWMCALVAVISIAKMVESMGDIGYGIMQKRERMDYIAKSVVIKGSVSFVAVALALYFTGSLITAVIFMAASWFAVIMAYDLSVYRRMNFNWSSLRPLWNWRMVKGLLALSMPLGFAAMLNSLNSNIPRYLIGGFNGSAALGYFVAISYILVAGDNVISALGQAASPRLSTYYFEDIRSFKKLLWKLMAIGAAIGAAGLLVAVFFGRDVLSIFFTPQYAAYNDLFILLMAAGIVIYMNSFVNYALLTARLLRFQAGLSLATAALCLVTGWFLIPAYGLNGAAWSIIITYCARLAAGLGTVLFHLRGKRA